MKKVIFKVVTWNDVQHTFKTVEEFHQYEQAENFIMLQHDSAEPLQIHKEWVNTANTYKPNFSSAGSEL